MGIESKFRTYGLQVVVFLSFLALFSLIIAGIVFYGYQSNLEIMLQSSDELLYQISETITRQINSHLEPANKNGIVIKRLIEEKVISSSTVDFNESFFTEALETYPQFQSIYFGDENGDYFMTYRDDDDTFITKIVYRTTPLPGIRLIKKDLNHILISDKTTSDINYDPRERPWYVVTKKEGKPVWTSEYFLFTAREPGVTCAQPIFDSNQDFKGAVGIDFKLNEINTFLKSLKIGETGTAFLCNDKGEIFAHPAKASFKKGNPRNPTKGAHPRSPAEQALKNGPENEAIKYYQDSQKYKFNFTHKGERYLSLFRPLSDKYSGKWTLGIIVPEDDFIGPIARIHETTLLFSFWLLIIAGFLTATLAKELTDPIHRAIEEADRIQNLDFDGEIDLQSPITEIQDMSNTMNSMKKALSSFKKYVPSEIVKELVKDKNEAKLEAQASKITILFTDIDGFSSISEEGNPRDLVNQLAEYFDSIAKIIHNHNGTIDKYIGDSVMAFWGAPHPDENQAKEACLASLEIQKSIKELNQKWVSQGRKAFNTRVGINTGISFIGNFGSTERFNYTAIGDSVNLANRLESLNKVYGSRIILSESTQKEAGSDLIFRVLDIVAVKGRQQSVTVYELLGTKNQVHSRALMKLSEASEMALVHYLSSQWEEAEEKYKSILKDYPEDKTAQMFINRCQKLKGNPPEKWDGVYRLTQK